MVKKHTIYFTQATPKENEFKNWQIMPVFFIKSPI